MRNSVLFVAAASLLGWKAPGTSAIDTVDSFDKNKYLGKWFQLYSNEFTSMFVSQDSTCVAADYGLDEQTGNITVINSSRLICPTGELSTITGYAYDTGPENPGQLKVSLSGVPVDGDYWLAGLGPETFGPEGLYEWAIVTGPDAITLFVLVRDVKNFEAMYEAEVLQLLQSLDFTGPIKEPIRVVQEGCLPFDPSMLGSSTPYTPPTSLRGGDTSPISRVTTMSRLAPLVDRDIADRIMNFENLNMNVGEAERRMLVTAFVHQLAQDAEEIIAEVSGALYFPVESVDTFDINRYTGRWYQAYSSYTVETLLEQKGACVTADYALNADGTISVTNTARADGVNGNLVEMKGVAYSADDAEPGQLMVKLDGIPIDAPLWVLAVGDENGSGPYPWAIVSDPLRAFLFVLVRDPGVLSCGSQVASDLIQLSENLGFTNFWNTPRGTVQEGCTYTNVV